MKWIQMWSAAAALAILGGTASITLTVMNPETLDGNMPNTVIASAMSRWENYPTPDTGTVKFPVFMVDFTDVKYADTVLTGDALYNAIFNENEKGSVTQYYETASYGMLTFAGNVYTYHAPKAITDYEGDSGFEDLAMEVLLAFDDEIDYTQYDANADGILDAFILCVPTGGDANFWWGCQATWYQNEDFTIDGLYPHYYVMCDSQADSSDIGYFQKTLCHELGHCMGLPDYYKYDNDTDWDAMHGIAGYELMDDMEGDLSQFSKLQLGWLTTSQVEEWKRTGETCFTLPSSSKGGCIIIRKNANTVSIDMSETSGINDIVANPLNGPYQDEYFLIEYDTADGNFTDCFTQAEEGVRILHVEAECDTDGYDWYYKYNNYGPDYDTTGEGIRVIRRVDDDNDGYLQAGDSVSYGEKGMTWYDESKDAFTVTIESIDEDGAHIVIR